MPKPEKSSSNIALLKADKISRVVLNGGKRKDIIADFSYEFSKGEIYNILGPSGAGKSSLLRLFNRLDELTGGTIIFNNEDIREINPCELRKKIGYLLQTPFMFPGTIKDNLLYVVPSLSDDSLNSMLAEVNLSPEMLESSVENLSVGEKQRVALVRLYLLEPEILLLDEPTSALDEKNSSLILNLIKRRVSENGATAIIVTHHPKQASAFQGEALLIIDGRLVEYGQTEKLICSPETEEGKTFLEECD